MTVLQSVLQPAIFAPEPLNTTDLNDGDVHLWRWLIDCPAGQLADLRSYLAADELIRAEQYAFDRDREHFIAARGYLRSILACYVGADPCDIQFEYGPHGKPHLLGQASVDGLHFNLSHAHGVALCAVARGRQVGVDIELIRPAIDMLGIARTTFSRGEYNRLKALPPRQRLPAFYACWSRKEAYIKARGEGLSYTLDAFDVSFEPDVPAAILRSAEGQGEQHRWEMHSLEAGPAYAAAVVIERPVARLSRMEWH